MKEKMCFILPEFGNTTSTNTVYQSEFIDKISSKINTFVIYMKSQHLPVFKNVKRTYALKFLKGPLRHIELLIVLLWARLLGYNIFYNYFIFLPALYSKFITRFFGGKTIHFISTGHITKDDVKKVSGYRQMVYFIKTLKAVDLLVVSTKDAADHFSEHLKLNKEKIKTMPYWINEQRFSPNVDKDIAKRKLQIDGSNIVILFIHQLSERKGAHHLPTIAKSVVKEIPEALFLVIGGKGLAEDCSEYIKEEIKRLALDDKLKLLGAIPYNDIHNYYAAADLFIMPSEYEGFGIVLLEAMASGIPFVATDGGGCVKEFTTHLQQEYIVPTGNIELFSQKIIEIARDENKRNLLVQAGLSQVKKYTIDAVADRFLKEIIS